MARYGRVALGGTFDRFHVGHEVLLDRAFQAGRSVAIGLTSRRFLAAHPKPRGRAIAPEAARRRTLSRWLRHRYPSRRWAVVPLDDPFGGAVGEGVDALVVSVDTVAGGRAVNRERVRRGLRPVPMLVVPLVLADDLEPVSSRRVRSGEIDRQGHRRTPISVGLSVAEGAARRASLRAIRTAFPTARVTVVPPAPHPGASGPVVRRLVRQAAEGRGLGVAVAPARPNGWLVAVRGPHAGLDPRRLPGDAPRELEAELASLLRPAPPKPPRR